MKIKILSIIMLFAFTAKAQTTTEKILKDGIKFNLTEDGKNFAKIGLGSQIWARYTEFNQDVPNKYGDSKSSGFDISLRRTFFSLYTKFDRFTIFSMVGVSSQTDTKSTGAYAGNKNAEFFLYDTWASYRLIDEHLTMGMGLNMYSGLSRYSSATSSKALSADVPFVACPDLLTTAQNARHLGLFATGKFGMFDYRISIVKPFRADNVKYNDDDSPKNDIAFDIPADNLGVKGYFTMQLWDKETHEMPFKASTYIGKKKVLNFGIGFDYQPEATITYSNLHENKDTKKYTADSKLNDKLHLAADVFMDLPFKDGSAITFYTGVFKFDYGKNYLLSYGVMDTHSGSIKEPQQGTGFAMNTQIAYLIPSKSAIKLQPYYTFDLKDYDALNDKALHHNMGMNFFMAGHKAKFGLEYQLRPYFADGKNFDSYKGMGIFKMSFSI